MTNHWEIVDRGDIVVSSSPEGLWYQAAAYFKWSDENPIVTKATLKSGREAGTTVKEEHIRPYSIKALCLHCGITEEWLRDIRASKDKSSLYYIVVSKILYIIYIQNLEMATIGQYSPVFTARVLNMEKDDTPVGGVKVEIVGGLPELSKSENEILSRLESENRI